MRRLFPLVLAAVACGALAQTPPKQQLEPLPEPGAPAPGAQGVAPEQGGVTIRPGAKGQKVEEIRQDGRVIALKVTPENGKPYYLINIGGGNWVQRSTLGGVSVPQWPIKTWQ